MPGIQPNADRSRERASASPLSNIQETQAESEVVNAYEDDESHDLQAVLSTPLSSRGDRQRAGSQALGSSPWVAANLSIFSPTAMASSPIRPSPVRWRIASPVPETQVAQTAEVSTPEDAEVEVPEVSQSYAEDHSVSRESTPTAGGEAQEEADMQSSPTQHGSEREERQFEDVAVDYMGDTDWRAYEREDSPMSSHDGETGGEEIAAEVDGSVREEGRDESAEATQQDLAEGPETQPNIELVPQANGETDILPEQSAPEMESQTSVVEPTQDPTETEQPVIVTKKKVGRICLRLPLHPTIVKIEPLDDAYSAAAKETETSTTTETDDTGLAVAQEPEVPLMEEQSPPVDREAMRDQEAELAVPEEQASLSLTGDVPLDESPETENVETETQDAVVEAESEAVGVAVERSEPVVETPATVVSQEPAVAIEPPALVQSSTTVLHADSPFQQRPTQETVSQTPIVSQGDNSSKRLFRESVSSISVTSEDPRAAARAAALLKLVRWLCPSLRTMY